MDNTSLVRGSIPRTAVSLALQLVGDRWSLLVVRELLDDAHGFNDLARALPDLSRSLLSQRLKRLAQLGLIDRAEDANNGRPGSYRLTDRGLALRATVESLGLWAGQWFAPFERDRAAELDALLQSLGRGLNRESLPKPRMLMSFVFEGDDRGSAWIMTDNRRVVAEVGRTPDQPDLEVHTSPTVLHALWWGERKCQDARQRGDIGFVGRAEWANEFPRWFIPSA